MDKHEVASGAARESAHRWRGCATGTDTMRGAEGGARARSATASIGAIVFAALVPKCPLCVAAMLSAAGVGAAGAHAIAPLLRTAAFVAAGLVVALAAWIEWRRPRRACCLGARAARR